MVGTRQQWRDLCPDSCLQNLREGLQARRLREAVGKDLMQPQAVGWVCSCPKDQEWCQGEEYADFRGPRALTTSLLVKWVCALGLVI